MFIHLDNQPARYALTACKPRHIGIDLTPTAWEHVRSEAHPTVITPDSTSKKKPRLGSVPTTQPSANHWVRISCPLPRSTIEGRSSAPEDAGLTKLRLILSAVSHKSAHDGSIAEQQLLSITYMASGSGPGYHRAGLVCGVSPVMSNWAQQQSQERFEGVGRIMRSAYNAMVFAEAKERSLSCFSIDLLPSGVLFLNCPGNACGLGRPADGELYPGRGYELRSHNVDFLFQQLTLLMGLAAIHDLARADLWLPEHS